MTKLDVACILAFAAVVGALTVTAKLVHFTTHAIESAHQRSQK